MQFCNRNKEIEILKNTREKSLQTARMTFVVGRRRIGKTRLLIKAHEPTAFLYFFIARKSESLLCNEFVEEIKQKLHVEIFGTLKQKAGVLTKKFKDYTIEYKGLSMEDM